MAVEHERFCDLTILELMSERYLKRVIFVELIRILGASIAILILPPRLIKESHALDMVVDFLIGEEVAKMGIFEWIVRWEWDFVDVIGVDELFVVVGANTIVSAHA